MNWREAAAAGLWSRVTWWHLDRDEQRELLEMLRAVVPMIEIRNGMEKIKRYRLPGEIEERDTKAAALLPAEGELEAAVDDGLPRASERWAAARSEAMRELMEMQAKPERTEGDADLSRAAHVSDASDLLVGIDSVTAWGQFELPEEERDWLAELTAEVAHLAFVAGRHMQAAWGKEFEADAIRGAKSREGSERSVDARRAIHAPRTKRILGEMDRLLARFPKKGINWAADQARRNGFGTSRDANRGLYYTHRKKNL